MELLDCDLPKAFFKIVATTFPIVPSLRDGSVGLVVSLSRFFGFLIFSFLFCFLVFYCFLSFLVFCK